MMMDSLTTKQPTTTSLTSVELPLATGPELLGKFQRRYILIPVPQLGVQFRHQNLNELERSRVENSILNNKGRIRGDRLLQIKVRWIQATAVDEHGTLLYGERDIPTLAQQDSAIIDLLMEGIKRHVGIKDDDLEETEKNCERTSDGASR